MRQRSGDPAVARRGTTPHTGRCATASECVRCPWQKVNDSEGSRRRLPGHALGCAYRRDRAWLSHPPAACRLLTRLGRPRPCRPAPDDDAAFLAGFARLGLPDSAVLAIPGADLAPPALDRDPSAAWARGDPADRAPFGLAGPGRTATALVWVTQQRQGLAGARAARPGCQAGGYF